MFESDKYFFENVVPTKRKDFSTNLKLNDANDLLDNQKKMELLFFSQKVNKIIFMGIIFFFFIIIFKVQKVFFYFSESSLTNNFSQQNRGKIFDRNGELIATNIDTKDFYLDTRKILNKEKLKEKLKEIFPNKKKSFFDEVVKKRQYIKVKSYLTVNEENKLKRLGDPSIMLHNSTKRIYLQHNLFSHLTGFKSLDLKSKIEKNLDSQLKEGKDIKLTLDLRIQHMVHEELLSSLRLYNANSAVSIIMNVNNGEIISLVSLPDFNPNHPEDIKAFTENNLAFEARYEMGSTLKIFNAALVYENDLPLENTEFTIKEGYQITSAKLIKDEHIKKSKLSFDEIFTQSSNVGSIKILEKVGIKKQKNLFKKLNIDNQISLNG